MTLEPIHRNHAAELPLEDHTVLLYSDNDTKASAKRVSEALSRGQLTIYVPVDSDNSNNKSKRTTGIELDIKNYEDHVNYGNLLTLDARSFYNSVLEGNMEPFEELKVLLEEAIMERILSDKNSEVTFVSGIGGTLAINQKFNKSIDAEKWWHDTLSEWLQKGLRVTLICSHPRTIFDRENQQELMQYKQAMLSLHETVVDASPT